MTDPTDGDPPGNTAQTDPDSEAVVDIGDERQLFIDDYVVDSVDGVKMETHRPTPRETVLTLDRPWEGRTSWCPVVHRDGDRYRMWYRASGENHSYLAYAESSDGIDWERPSLGFVEFDGSTDNNILPEGNPGGNSGILIDENPEAPPEERYKALGRNWYPDEPSELWGYTSPDGIEWETIGDEPLVVAPDDDMYMDSPVSVFWDDDRSRYALYVRGLYPDGGEHRIRGIRTSTSENFLDWEPLQSISIGDDALWREHLYTNSAQRYYRAPIYLSFPKRFVPDRQYLDDWGHKGQSDVLMFASRDGVNWVRPYDGAFLRPGRDERNWHDRSIYIAQDAVPTDDGELSMYSIQHYRTENVHIKRLTMREDGFVSARAGRATGELVTKPLEFDGDRLEVNFATSGAGSLRVELLDRNKNPLQRFTRGDCKELFGDEIDRPVGWKRAIQETADHPREGEVEMDIGYDVGSLRGQTVRIRFILQEADLYSFRFAPDEGLQESRRSHT